MKTRLANKMENRSTIAKLICDRLAQQGIKQLQEEYFLSGKINYFIVDDLLPFDLANKLDSLFPLESQLNMLDERQERKYVGVNFSKNQLIVEECVYAFQHPSVIKKISEICGITDLEGDSELYAGAGVSSMSYGCFLNPHIDNSHNRLKKSYRRLNLLYYVSREMSLDNGGQLMLYPDGIKNSPISIDSLFNRLVVMRTDNRSLHAVSKIVGRTARRKTVSNYYFSSSSPDGNNYYHSTSFRAFPDESRRKDLLLRLNAASRSLVKSLTGNFIGRVINTGLHRGGSRS